VPISALQSGDMPGAFFKKLLRKSPDKKELERLIKSLKSLKHVRVFEEIARLKDVPVNELTLDIACDGILALQKAVSLKKHRNIIDEYRGISGNKELSVSAVYETLDGVKDTLQKLTRTFSIPSLDCLKTMGQFLSDCKSRRIS